jgi:hypothetical protein
MNQDVHRFLKDSGLKLLAISNLSASEYSIILYLLNGAVSGLHSLITDESQLASIIGHPVADVREAIDGLVTRNIVKAHYGDGTQKPTLQSVSLSIKWDIARWNLMNQEEHSKHKNHHEAIIFQFSKSPQWEVIEGSKSSHDRHSQTWNKEKNGDIETWHRIVEVFSRSRNLDDAEISSTEDVARILIQAHPVDQIVLMIRHFGLRIPTLSLLASNWDHFNELYEQEHQNLDLFEFRQKQVELDQKARDAAQNYLIQHKDQNLSEEEIQILELLTTHRHPRRQLFWAHQQRIRYPKLKKFFEDTHDLMLPITQNGQVVKMLD